MLFKKSSLSPEYIAILKKISRSFKFLEKHLFNSLINIELSWLKDQRVIRLRVLKKVCLFLSRT